MPVLYPILKVSADDLIGDEALGSKTKFWFKRDEQRWLYKEARENTGEDWAEKVAAEIAKLVGINAAIVELADYEGKRGSASLSFVNLAQGDVLIHGNEILAGQVLGYDLTKQFHQSDHTLDNIRDAICKMFLDSEIHHGVLTELAGYLVLDALIGNTDRHHENWGLMLSLTQTNNEFNAVLTVAPSFDHASSLGRELLDEKRVNYLRSGSIENYIRKGRGAVFLSSIDSYGANPIRLVELGMSRFSEYFLPSLNRLKGVTMDQLYAVVDCVPPDRITDATREFTKAFIFYTHESLCKLVK